MKRSRRREVRGNTNNLTIINEQEVLGKHFAIYGDFDNPLFLAKDVASWIEYSKDGKGNYNVSTMLSTIDEDEKIKIFTNLNNNQVGSNTWFLTEDGLYEVLMQSRKPIAKQFKHEVKRILKDIRKHGIYAIDELLNNPDMAIKAFTALKEEQEKRKALEMEVEQTKPLVLFANSVQASQTSILIGELAKLLKQNGISIGEKRLFECLRDNGYLIKRKGSDWNMPTQKSMELGLFEVKETVVTHSDGHITVNKTTKVTGKGQIYFTDLFINKLAKTG